jgi:hypothetical protein
MKKTDLFTKLDNTIGNFMDESATLGDLLNIIWKVNKYLIEHPHPHDSSIKTKEK